MTMPPRSNWMLYGAYGTSGRLILDEALRRGHRPLLTGRDSAQLSALGRTTGLSILTVPLHDGAALRAALSRASCVQNADSRRMRFAAAPMAELLAVQRSTGIPNLSRASRSRAVPRRSCAWPARGSARCWRGKPRARRAELSASNRQLPSRGFARVSGPRRATPQAGASPPCWKPARAIARRRPPRSARWSCSSASLALALSHPCRHLGRNSRCSYRAHASRRFSDHVEEAIARSR